MAIADKFRAVFSGSAKPEALAPVEGVTAPSAGILDGTDGNALPSGHAIATASGR
jgi:hypothetical protein